MCLAAKLSGYVRPRWKAERPIAHTPRGMLSHCCSCSQVCLSTPGPKHCYGAVNSQKPVRLTGSPAILAARSPPLRTRRRPPSSIAVSPEADADSFVFCRVRACILGCARKYPRRSQGNRRSRIKNKDEGPRGKGQQHTRADDESGPWSSCVNKTS